MERKINEKRLVELSRIFKLIHNDSSEVLYLIKKIRPFDTDWYKEDHNEAFMKEIKPLLLSLRRKYKEKLTEIKTFLSNDVLTEKDNLLNLADYLEIIEKSTNYPNYLHELIKRDYIQYNQRLLNYFTSEYLFNDYISLEMVIEIKDIKLVKNYQYPQEKVRFDDVEYHWKIREYDEVFEGIYDILPNFCQDYLGIEELKKERDIPETLKQIFNKLKTTIDNYNIPNLGEILEIINKRIEKITTELNETSNDFFKIRSKFGKDQGITKENKGFEDASELSKKVCSRMVIDLLKVIHNALLVADIGKNE